MRYWEIFYWDMNNEDAHLYNPPKTSKTKTISPFEIIYISLQLEELSAKLNSIGNDAVKTKKEEEEE